MKCKTSYENKSLCAMCFYGEDLHYYNGKSYCHDRAYNGAFCTDEGLTHLESAMNKRIENCQYSIKNDYVDDNHYCEKCPTSDIIKLYCILCKSSDIKYSDTNYYNSFVMCYDCKEYVSKNKYKIHKILSKINERVMSDDVMNIFKKKLCECCKKLIPDNLITEDMIKQYIQILDKIH